MRKEHKGWHARGYLPHYDGPGVVQSVTFRLVDSVPARLIDAWLTELGLSGREAADDPRAAELRKRIDEFADRGYGECWLRQPALAQVAESAINHFDGERYCLLAWCVMPNHVHVLAEAIDGYPLGDVVHSWKSYTAHRCNRLLGRTGRFWMRDYFDRYIRDVTHFRAVTEYIESNPVKAGLCRHPEEWRWSSARHSPREMAG